MKVLSPRFVISAVSVLYLMGCVALNGMVAATGGGPAMPISEDSTVGAQDRVEDVEPRTQGRLLCRLANREITESSGIAYSTRNKGILWTHNDSGDKPRVFAFDLEGRDHGVFEIDGVRAVDWEDMASIKWGERSYLLIADVGDNRRKRKEYSIYLVEEPEITSRSGRATRVLTPSRIIRFRYEDGPRNCESVAIDPLTGAILLVSRTWPLWCKVYRLPPFMTVNGQTVEAKAIADLDLNLTTAMDISPDGKRAVILTYDEAYEYVRESGQEWDEAFLGEPVVIPVPARQQGESVCYGPDGMTLYLTSEGTSSPLWEVRLSRESK